MPITTGAIFAAAAIGAGAALKVSEEVALNNGANYIATGNPSGLLPRAGLEIARATCRRYAANPASLNANAAAQYETACRPYLDANGWGSGPGVVGGLPGQCAGLGYNFYTESRTAQSGWNEGALIRVFGPISARSITQIGTAPVVTQWSVTGRTSTGQPLTATANNGVSRENARWGRVTQTPGNGDPYACTTQPPTLTPPTPAPQPLPPRFPITIAPNFDVDVDVAIDVDGRVTVNFPDLTVEIGDPFADPEVVPPSGGIAGDDLVPGGGLSGNPADTGDGGVAEGEAPSGQELVGVRVEVLQAPVNFNSYDRVAVTVYRGIGYVRMGYPGRLALDMGGAALINPQFFLAPVRGLTAWEVRANNGFINRVTPFYRELPS